MFLFQVLQDVIREFWRSLTSCGATYFQGKHAISWISSCQYKTCCHLETSCIRWITTVIVMVFSSRQNKSVENSERERLVKRFGKSYPQFAYAHHRQNKNGRKSVMILKKYGIYPIVLGQFLGNTLQLNVPKNLDQNILTTKAFLALSFWQSMMPNTASYL